MKKERYFGMLERAGNNEKEIDLLPGYLMTAKIKVAMLSETNRKRKGLEETRKYLHFWSGVRKKHTC